MTNTSTTRRVLDLTRDLWYDRIDVIYHPMENEFIKWFERSNGSWTSSRRYLYGPKRKADTYNTEFTVETVGNKVKIAWDGDASDGTMNMVIEDHMLKRDSGYFSDDPTESAMSLIDHNTVVFITSYDGVTYREEIRLLADDKYRLRQTVATKEDTGSVIIVGQYFEERA